jgi:phosphatidylglycerophosphatase A
MKYVRPATPDFLGLFKKASLPGKSALLFSSCFGVGLIPVAQGTFGTLAAIPLAVMVASLSPLTGGSFIFFFILLAIWASDRGAKVLHQGDPSEIVIDEMAGILTALFLLPISVKVVCLGFFLFRLFDILKPYPIRRLEKIGGGTGIVVDDLMAGVYANLCLRFALLFLVS